VAETSLGSLPGADGRYPVSESFTDALGRETNSVRAVWHYTSRDPAYAPLQTRTEYPYGTDHYRVVTDPLGVQTVSRNQSVFFGGKYRLIEETISAGVTNRSSMIPGAAPVEERFWDGKWTRTTRTASFGADGCRAETTVTESSDYPAVTNSITTYDFLGRVARVQTPAFGGGWLTTSNFYDGASSRLLRVTRTGQPGTLYPYDALGNPAATALDIDGDGVFTAADLATAADATHEQDAAGDWWRVTTRTRTRGGSDEQRVVLPALRQQREHQGLFGPDWSACGRICLCPLRRRHLPIRRHVQLFSLPFLHKEHRQRDRSVLLRLPLLLARVDALVKPRFD
jgi:hypothetical protein